MTSAGLNTRTEPWAGQRYFWWLALVLAVLAQGIYLAQNPTVYLMPLPIVTIALAFISKRYTEGRSADATYVGPDLYVDEETGLPSGAAFALALRRQCDRANRAQAGFSLALVSIPNPERPSGSGPEITRVARSLRKQLDEVDVIARLEGSMLGVIIVDGPLETSWAKAERLSIGFPQHEAAATLCSITAYEGETDASLFLERAVRDRKLGLRHFP